jgi:hypothetical protein
MEVIPADRKKSAPSSDRGDRAEGVSCLSGVWSGKTEKKREILTSGGNFFGSGEGKRPLVVGPRKKNGPKAEASGP